MKKIGIIGGGAAGLACAVFLARKSRFSVTVFERSPRVGRKLSATGNGQGNVTNTDMGAAHYFSDDIGKTGRILGASILRADRPRQSPICSVRKRRGWACGCIPKAW